MLPYSWHVLLTLGQVNVTEQCTWLIIEACYVCMVCCCMTSCRCLIVCWLSAMCCDCLAVNVYSCCRRPRATRQLPYSSMQPPYGYNSHTYPPDALLTSSGADARAREHQRLAAAISASLQEQQEAAARSAAWERMQLEKALAASLARNDVALAKNDVIVVDARRQDLGWGGMQQMARR